MKLTYYGHSCFLITGNSGTRILTDPCDPETGYCLKEIAADAVTVSHEHHDHNYVQAAAGTPEIIRTAGLHVVKDITIEGIPAWHDNDRGVQRGENMIYRMELDGMRLVHLGDLGHVPDETLAQAIGPADVLLCPIGGVYTIDTAQALETAERLQARILIPMHYSTPQLTFPLGGLEELLRLAKDRGIHRVNDSTCSISQDAIGEKRILILNHRKN